MISGGCGGGAGLDPAVGWFSQLTRPKRSDIVPGLIYIAGEHRLRQYSPWPAPASGQDMDPHSPCILIQLNIQEIGLPIRKEELEPFEQSVTI